MFGSYSAPSVPLQLILSAIGTRYINQKHFPFPAIMNTGPARKEQKAERRTFRARHVYMYVYRCSARALLVRLAGEAWSSSSFFFMLLKQTHNPSSSWNRHITHNALETDAQPFKLLKWTLDPHCSWNRHKPLSSWNRHMIHHAPETHNPSRSWNRHMIHHAPETDTQPSSSWNRHTTLQA